MSTAWNETDLDDLRRFFYQEAPHAGLAHLCGASLITWPDSPDPDQQSLYAGCQELARRGLVRSRPIPDSTGVVFYGPSDPDWQLSLITAALGIPAELLQSDGTRRNRS